MKIDLHIGLEKTGTTSIQNFLASNREGLRQQAILFPKSPGNTNHRKLTAYAVGDRSNDTVRDFYVREKGGVNFEREFLAEFKREIAESGMERMILSNEHCSSRLTSPEQLVRLKRLLEEVGEVRRIIIYLRRQDEFLISTYSTSIKNGHKKIFKIPKGRAALARYDFDQILEMWSEVFTSGVIFPRIFSKSEFFGGDLLEDFCFIAEILRDDISFDVEDRNISLSAMALEFLRSINVNMSDKLSEGRVRNRIVRYIGSALPGAKISMSVEQRKSFLEKFARGNVNIAKKYFGRPDGVLFDPVREDLAEIPLPNLTLREFTEFTAEIMISIASNSRRRDRRS